MSYPFNPKPQNDVFYAPFDSSRGAICHGESSNSQQLGGAVGAGAAAPLGSKRQFPDIAGEVKDRKVEEWRKLERRAKFADQREAARIMWQHSHDGRPGGVTFCGWTKQAMAEAVEVIRVTKPDVAPRAFLAGTAKCKLGWVCPICTAAKAEAARHKLNAVLSKGRRVGWHMVMITLTVRHDRDMPLDWLWSRLSASSDLFRETYAWKQINKRLVGSVKTVEATHGENGWHPHFHVVLVFKAEAVKDQAEAEALAESLRSEWMTQLGMQGLTGNDRAFQVQGAASAGNYLSKWGAAEELTLGHAKQGRVGQRSPWQLLRDSREGDQDAGELWYQFVTVLKGTHQIRITPGLNREVKAELERLKEEKAEAISSGKLKDEPETQTVMVRYDDHDEWMEEGRHRRVQMLEGAEARTHKDAEQAVCRARHSAETDADLMRVVLIESDDEGEVSPAPYDTPETPMERQKEKKRQRRRERDRRVDVDWDAMAEMPFD